MKLLGFSGKLNSGKDTCTNWIFSRALILPLQQVPRAYVNDSGKLMVGLSPETDGEFDLYSREPQVMDWLHKNVWWFLRSYPMAEALKDICVSVLGVEINKIWGSDKNAFTHLKWEDCPKLQRVVHKSGSMTGRETMEYFGELVRQLYPNAWVKANESAMDAFQSQHGIVPDIRHENEVDMIRRRGGHIIRLTRTTPEAEQNNHISNTALDNYSDFDKVIDNQNQTIPETLLELSNYLKEIGWIGDKEVNINEQGEINEA